MTVINMIYVLLLMFRMFSDCAIQTETEILCKFRPDTVYHGLLAECKNLNIREVPKTFPPNTTSIDLSYNKISVLRNNSFSSLVQLKRLVLQRNDLTHMESLAFRACSMLHLLDLSWNNLSLTSASYPDCVFDSLHNLKYLDMKNNKPGNEGFYPERIFLKLANLEVLKIDAFEEPQFGQGIGGLSNLKELILGELNCQMNTLRNSTFLPLVNTSLEVLDIAGCRFRNFDMGTFAPLFKLQELLMGSTDIGIKGTLKSLSSFAGHTLRTIDLYKIRQRFHHSGIVSVEEAVLDNNDLKYLAPVCVEKFIMGNCGLIYINMASLVNTKFSQCLMYLDVSMNRLFIDPLEYLVIYSFQNLTYVDISFQEHFRRPRRPGNMLLSRHKDNQYSETFISQEVSNYTIMLPKRLLYANASAVSSTFGNIYGNISIVNGALLKINASYMGIHHLNAHISGLDNLTTLDISGNPSLVISDSFFDTFPSLKALHVSHSSLPQDAVLHQGKRLLQSLQHLKSFHLADNHLSDLPNEIFHDNHLLEKIDLTGNLFRAIPFDLKFTPKLNVLDMTSNAIGFLDKADQRMIDSYSERVKYQFQLLLDGNVFRCDCQGLEFLFWLKETRYWLDRKGNYTCLLENGKISNTAHEVNRIDHLWRNCIGVNLFYLSSFLMALTSMSLLSVLLIKTNKTTIRCMIENIISLELPVPKRSDFKYDLYIAYADKDYQWVCHHFRQALEERQLSLFIWDRDSDVGSSIPDQIAEGMDQSWKILLNFTVNFGHGASDHTSIMAGLNRVDNNNPEKIILLLPEMELDQPRIPNCILEIIPESCIIRVPYSDANNFEFCDIISDLVKKET